jgi:ABC-type nitrate/sulfonate/bicarbonate transport system ATPase subunit
MVFQNHSLLPWLTVFECRDCGQQSIQTQHEGGSNVSVSDWIEHRLKLVSRHALDKYPQETADEVARRHRPPRR